MMHRIVALFVAFVAISACVGCAVKSSERAVPIPASAMNKNKPKYQVMDDDRPAARPPAHIAELLPDGSAELCAQLTPAECAQRGFAYERGRGVDRDADLAVQHYAAACRAGSALGCSNLAGAYGLGIHVQVDPKRADLLYGYACQAGYLRACTKVGFRQAAGCATDSPHKLCTAHTVTPAEAGKLIGSACEAESKWQACATYASMLAFRGEAERAEKMYQNACRHGVAFACHHLADTYRNRGSQDQPRVVELHEKACAMDFAASCTKLGMIHSSRGDKATARKLVRRGCELGEWRACEALPTFE